MCLSNNWFIIGSYLYVCECMRVSAFVTICGMCMYIYMHVLVNVLFFLQCNLVYYSLSLSPSLSISIRPTNECLMEFVFNTEVNTGRQILTSWNMALMELVDPQKLNVISNILSKQGSGGKEDKGGNKSNSLSKNFFGSLKHKGQSSTKDEKGACISVTYYSICYTNVALMIIACHMCV